MRPHHAVLMAALLNAAGAFAGTAVAATIGKGIVRAEVIDIQTVGAAMMGIVIWSTVAWYYGLPTSESHGLVAGLAGAGLATAGPSALLWEGWSKVLVGLVFSSFLGFLMGMLLMVLISWVCRRWHPATVRRIFGRLQVLSASFMAFSHGSNDGQKFIGVFTLALMLGGILPEFAVPTWVILLCSVTMGVGTAVGGGESSGPSVCASRGSSRSTASPPKRGPDSRSWEQAPSAFRSPRRTRSPRRSWGSDPRAGFRPCAGAWRGTSSWRGS